jgi:hypothetical protein
MRQDEDIKEIKIGKERKNSVHFLFADEVIL